MNPLAIALAALAAFVFGLIYHRFVAPSRIGGPRLSLGTLATMLISYLVAAWVLAGTLGHLGVGQVTLRNGLISAGFVWAGFIATALTLTLRLQGLGWRVIAAHAAHWLLAALIMGAMIGGLGV